MRIAAKRPDFPSSREKQRVLTPRAHLIKIHQLSAGAPPDAAGVSQIAPCPSCRPFFGLADLTNSLKLLSQLSSQAAQST